MAIPVSDIHRTFFDLPADENSDIDQAEFLASFPGGRRLTWEQLLESDRILIVSEAGAGKSYECQRQQQKLWSEGESAFFVELAVLATESLETQFSEEEKSRFSSWLLAQTERATFFLDSVDELKLTQRSFELTLKRFSAALMGNLGRARIVLTTRPIAVDRDLVRKWLPVPPLVEIFVPESHFANVAMRIDPTKNSDSSASPQWRFVALSPLDQQQMHTFATVEGISDPEALLHAIETQYAHEFAKRPLDFIELCGDWKVHGKIRSHKEQVNHSVDVKLRPRIDRAERVALPPERARDGAERLALAALLTRRFTIWHGSDNDRSLGNSALDPSKILTNWPEDELRTLLERPLFGFASYGRIRFHNRSVIEFLAAERLQGLLQKGMSIKTLKRLLFATTQVDLLVVKPTMEPVTAWLAASNSVVRAEVLDRDPSILLRLADPESLDLAMRTQALQQYVSVFGSGGWRGQHVPALQIQRLASPELAPAIESLWMQGIENPEVRETLLELIGAGKMKSCADIAHAVAIDTSLGVRDRLHGLVALSELDDHRLSQFLDQLLINPVAWSAGLASAVSAHLFPQHMSVTHLLAALTILKPHPREIGGIPTILPLSIEKARLQADQLELLRAGLMALIETSCRWHDQHYRIDAKRQDLVPALLVVCNLQLAVLDGNRGLFDSIVLAMQLAEDDVHGSDERRALGETLSSTKDTAREEIFWAHDRLMEQRDPSKEKDAWHRAFSFVHHRLFDITWAQDSSWVRRSLAKPERAVDERGVLLELGMWLARSCPDQLDQLRAMETLVADSDELSERLKKIIDSVESPAPVPKWMRDDQKRKEESRRKHAKDLASWKMFWRDLINDPDAAFSQDRQNNTAWNLWRAMSNETRDRGISGWNRGFIERVFNRETADRLREAMKIAWRKDRPTIKSERPTNERNSYLQRWRMGLAGIHAEAEDPAWAATLNADEVDLAIRYALIEINGFPIWMDSLIEAHPSIVESIIGKELRDELNDVSDRHSMLLQEIENSSPLTIQLFLNSVRSWFQAALFEDADIEVIVNKLERAARLQLEHGTAEDAEFLKTKALAKLQVGANQSEVLFWLPILMRLDASAAVDVMEKLAEPVSPVRYSVVMEWFSELFGQRGNRNQSDLFALESNPHILLRLTLLAYRHVQFRHDVQHNGAYSPDGRDHAEHARSLLGNMLLNAKGVEAWHAKVKFSNDPLVAHFRDRALMVAKEKMAEEWDAALFDEAGVVRLEREYEFAPITRADMAALLDDRLADLDDLLLQDTSPRELWGTISLERLLRRAVAAELQNLAGAAYWVNQEAITGDEKETDVRLRSTASTQEAVIELKVGENDYSVVDFYKALNTQLLQKYLAPENRRVGCLLISVASKGYWLHPDDGRRLDSKELVALLNEEAKRLVETVNGEVHIYAKILDLRARV